MRGSQYPPYGLMTAVDVVWVPRCTVRSALPFFFLMAHGWKKTSEIFDVVMHYPGRFRIQSLFPCQLEI